MSEDAQQAEAEYGWVDILVRVYVGASMLFVLGIPLVGVWWFIAFPWAIWVSDFFFLSLGYGGAFLIGLFPVYFAVRTFSTGSMRLFLVAVLAGLFSYFGTWLAVRVLYEILVHPGLD